MRTGKFGRWGYGAAWLCAALAFGTICTPAQERQSAPSSGNGGAADSPDSRALANTVSELQAEVSALSTQLGEMRAAQQRSDGQMRRLQDQLLHAEGKPSAAVASASAADSPMGYGSSPEANLVATPMNSSSNDSADRSPSLPDRLQQVEEYEDLENSRLEEQSQSKIESGSKYRVRLSGIVLLNVFSNRGGVDNQDFPAFAQETDPPFSSSSFGASVRQSQFALEAFGPSVGNARTSARIDFDFAGGFPQDAPNGQTMGIMRLRTAVVRLDWANTSVIVGQDRLFFAPLSPTSIASLAVPPLSYAGNLWSWTPQVRVEHVVHLSERSSFTVQGGILDSLSGDLPSDGQSGYSSWGEQSSQPAYASRVALSFPFLGHETTLGTGGYYGRQFWGFGRHVDGWASTIDISVPLSRMFALTGAFYRGRAVGGLGGALDQNVLMSGSLFSSATVIQGLDSTGGWMQLKFKPTEKFQINAAYGQDDPFASEMRRFPPGQSYYGYSFTRNQSPMANFIYQLRSDVEFSVEYRRLKTMALGEDTASANHYVATVGYKF